MNDVVIYAIGLVHASVCARKELTGEQVAAQVNAISPTGIIPAWFIDQAGVFASGDPNPCDCAHDAGRRHWLLTC